MHGSVDVTLAAPQSGSAPTWNEVPGTCTARPPPRVGNANVPHMQTCQNGVPLLTKTCTACLSHESSTFLLWLARSTDTIFRSGFPSSPLHALSCENTPTEA